MFRELYEAITAVVRGLLLSGPTFILLSQPPLVTGSFDLLRADIKFGGGRGWGEGGCNS